MIKHNTFLNNGDTIVTADVGKNIGFTKRGNSFLLFMFYCVAAIRSR